MDTIRRHRLWMGLAVLGVLCLGLWVIALLEPMPAAAALVKDSQAHSAAFAAPASKKTRELKPTHTPTQTPTKTKRPKQTKTPFVTPSPAPTETVQHTRTRKPTKTATPTGTLALTTTATPTSTPSAKPTSAIQLVLEPLESTIHPGERVIYLVTLTNTLSTKITVALNVTDSQAAFFTSTLDTDRVQLKAGESATVTLSVSASAEASAKDANVTTVRASVKGFKPVHAQVTTRRGSLQIYRTLSGLGVSPQKVAPDTSIKMQMALSSLAPLNSSVLTDYFPRAWQVLDSGNGTLSRVDESTQKIEWSLRPLNAGAIITKTYTLSSPAAALPPPEYTFQSVLTRGEKILANESASIVLEHPLSISHYRIGRNDPIANMTFAAKRDQPAAQIPRFKPFRVRFRVVNAQPDPVQWKPRLEWSARPNYGFVPVASQAAKNGEPFFIRPVRTVDNREMIPPRHFGLGRDAGTPQEGRVFTKQNPAATLTLDALSYTEIEFSVSATANAEYGRSYYFRLTDNGRLVGETVAQLALESFPSPQLTQPQYYGIDPFGVQDSTDRGKGRFALGSSSTNPHGSYIAQTDKCASCHRGQTARNRNLLTGAPAQSNVCFGCHDGSVSTKNIQSQYADTNVPPNNSGTSSFYAHPATTPSAHSAARNNEFGGVLERHAECSDCHNSHTAVQRLSQFAHRRVLTDQQYGERLGGVRRAERNQRRRRGEWGRRNATRVQLERDEHVRVRTLSQMSFGVHDLVEL
ncbi:MAG: hypothetical protein HY741_14240 [Chloroflexi bacterium]|nr:hypothetical protein [Chloroflexota bacterium]